MFLWNVEKCLKIFERVYVSSDDKDILTIAENSGAIPILRPKWLGGDTPNITVYLHALHYMDCGAIVAVQANSPTIHPYKIEAVRDELIGRDEVKTCHMNGKDYGSVWAMTVKRLLQYPDPWKAKPDIWIKDPSVDIHTIKDLENAEKQNIHYC